MQHESKYMIDRRNRMLGVKEEIKPEDFKKKYLPKKSEKNKVSTKEYKKIVVEMLLTSKKCEILSPVCTKIAQGLHHMKKRGIHLLDKKFLKRSCNACNSFIEQNTDWGIENGFILSKFN